MPSSSTTSSGSSERSTEAEACPVPPLCSSSPTPLHSTSPLPALARLLINGGHCMVGATHAHQCLHPPPGRPAPIYLLIQGDRALASNPAPAGPLRPIHPHPHPPPTPRPSSSPQCRLPASSAPGIPELEVGGDVKAAACVTTAVHLPATLLHIGAVPCLILLCAVLAVSLVCRWRWMTSSRSFVRGGSEGVALGPRLVSGGRSGLARGGVVG